MSQHRAGVAQRILRLAAGGGGEGLHDADQRLVLGVFAGRQVLQSRQQGLGRPVSPRSAASRPRSQARYSMSRQPAGVHRLGELRLGGIPVAELSSAWARFPIAYGQVDPGRRPGGGARRRSARRPPRRRGRWPPGHPTG